MARNHPLVLLASQSPRRRKILTFLSIPFKAVKPRDVDETPFPGESVERLVRRLAFLKAVSVSKTYPHMPVFAADTAVAQNHRIFGKPRNSAEARTMLLSLQGKKHEVWTGAAFVWQKKNIELSHIEKTTVFFKPLKLIEIKTYLKSKEPYDKAGAYDIQGMAANWIAKWEGDYFNVMGLPIQWIIRQIAVIKREINRSKSF